MDQPNRVAHLQDLLAGHAQLTQRLHDHRNRLLAHHRSRERDRALLHCDKDIRRAGKLQRGLERALRNEGKQHSS
ncbi:MAG: hypothetical protein QOC71_1708 [Thermoplasmata archaeon]|jgi:hypothetical protein|nr:hypothetical protein [Thermoplasmata archaeon]